MRLPWVHYGGGLNEPTRTCTLRKYVTRIENYGEMTVEKTDRTIRSRNAILREAARSFVEKASALPSVLEIAIIGSVAGNDPYAGDLDLAMVLNDFEDFKALARHARQISPVSHEWEVFVFDRDPAHKGRICHRRECSRQSVDCLVAGCGTIPHLRIISGFAFDERMFYESPFDILFSRGESLFLSRKNELGITVTRTYPVLKRMRVDCVECGRGFMIDPGEQKWFARRGMEFPKRCPKCRDARMRF